MKTIAFLCSGGGGNLRFLNLAIAAGLLPEFQLSAVIADRDCEALPYAQTQGLLARRIDYNRQRPQELRAALAEINPDVIVTNIHKIIDAGTVEQWGPRMVNLHYSLLPAFKGLIGAEPVRQALAAGCRFVGATAHRIAEDVDAGPIITQAAVTVTDAPFPELMNRVFRAGCLVLGNAVDLIGSPGRREPAALWQGHTIAPAPRFALDGFTEEFWAQVKTG